MAFESSCGPACKKMGLEDRLRELSELKKQKHLWLSALLQQTVHTAMYHLTIASLSAGVFVSHLGVVSEVRMKAQSL